MSGTGGELTCTGLEWCEVHKAPAYSHGRCAVAALAPLPVTIGCRFAGVVYVGPSPEPVTAPGPEVDEPAG